MRDPRRIGIVGWGIEGQSAYRYFGPEHEYLVVNEEPRDDFPVESASVEIQYLSHKRPAGMVGTAKDLSYLKGIDSCDKIIYQPSAYRNLQTAFGDDSHFWSKATTTLHIFFEEVKTKNIIGVTGTKGKGTTSTLIARLLESEGKKVYLGGNIGKSPLDFVKDVDADDWVVLELTNFQLYNFPYSPHIALSLIIAPEHMDWHSDMNEYVEAKANIFRHQKADDIAVYFAKNEYSKKIAQYSPGQKIPYFEAPGAYIRDDGMIVVGPEQIEVMPKSEVKLLGEHNLQNVCAALTAVFEALGALDKAKAVLSSFSGLEHRQEFVRDLEDVKYYDDSFAAAPGATMAALETISGPKIAIIGGFDRQLSLKNLALAVQGHSDDISKILLIGASAQRTAKELDEAGFSNYEILAGKTMPEIVSRAHDLAKAGDSVILSPGFPSFDMFKNFTERGLKFKEAVHKL